MSPAIKTKKHFTATKGTVPTAEDYPQRWLRRGVHKISGRCKKYNWNGNSHAEKSEEINTPLSFTVLGLFTHSGIVWALLRTLYWNLIELNWNEFISNQCIVFRSYVLYYFYYYLLIYLLESRHCATLMNIYPLRSSNDFPCWFTWNIEAVAFCWRLIWLQPFSSISYKKPE